ncbi:MAG: T9SS type B sorting domain-containing protein [Maribacter sp.]|nr:T9SS type B sorting domain-containing protein [Maribacter sp.]
MQKKALYLFSLILGFVVHGQNCPLLTNPTDGAINVPVNTSITWPAVDGIYGYLISLGTTPGGTDIINRRSSGLANFYIPEVGLPENTQIYSTISMFSENQQLIICPGETFRTVDVTTPPPCTTLNSPGNGEIGTNVNISIRWNYAPTATGYFVSIGTTPGGIDIAENIDVGNVLEYRHSEEFPLNQQIFVRIVPYNENGLAASCTEESFTTGEPAVDCGAISPLLDIPDQLGLCVNEPGTKIATDILASGYRWYKINSDGSETLLSEENEALITQTGRYRFEIYNNVATFGTDTECVSSKEFEAVLSALPIIDAIEVTRQPGGLAISVKVRGNGSYEYALDSENGPYQDAAIFANIPEGPHRIFVRDKNGCGSTDRLVEDAFTEENFPRFFTPNGDGINDHWQFIPPRDTGEVNVEIIKIYDRLGKLLAQIDPKAVGWDGNFNGKPVPSSDYWYWAISYSGRKIHGHFTLKR